MKNQLSVLFIAATLTQFPVTATQTTLSEQTDLSVTAYNSNIALVRDRRKLTLPMGEFDLTFMDVAEQIRPETVSLKSVSEPGSISILEQNYEFDLMSPEKMLEKYVGKTVELVNFQNDIGFSSKEAELLSTNGGSIYKIDGKIYLGHPGHVSLPEVPANLIAKPSLIWLLDNAGQTTQEIEASYLTGGISWKADYVVTLAKTEDLLNLDGWVTLTNHSGTSFTNAQLKLVAGDIHTASQKFGGNHMFMARASMANDAMEMTQEAFGDFHLYKLPRKTTIKNNQSKQVKLLAGVNVQAQKVYEYTGGQHFHFGRSGELKGQKVSSYLTFKNTKVNHLGIPMPAGTIRVYQEDSEGMLQFAGEDTINHTPKDEQIKIKLGEAFDLVVDRVQTDYKKISDRMHQSTHEITLKNRKDTDVVINVIEPMANTWKMQSKSHDFKKKDAFTAEFNIPVKANSEVVLTYTVQVSH